MHCFNVVLQVSFLSERHLATSVVASEWFLSSVGPEVAIELTLIEHYLAAFLLIHCVRPVQALEKVAL